MASISFAFEGGEISGSGGLLPRLFLRWGGGGGGGGGIGWSSVSVDIEDGLLAEVDVEEGWFVSVE